MAFGHFLLGSHTFMVTALGSCVKWLLEYPTKKRLDSGLHEKIEPTYDFCLPRGRGLCDKIGVRWNDDGTQQLKRFLTNVCCIRSWKSQKI